jgi:hypothetical protein
MQQFLFHKTGRIFVHFDLKCHLEYRHQANFHNLSRVPQYSGTPVVLPGNRVNDYVDSGPEDCSDYRLVQWRPSNQARRKNWKCSIRETPRPYAKCLRLIQITGRFRTPSHVIYLKHLKSIAAYLTRVTCEIRRYYGIVLKIELLRKRLSAAASLFRAVFGGFSFS